MKITFIFLFNIIIFGPTLGTLYKKYILTSSHIVIFHHSYAGLQLMPNLELFSFYTNKLDSGKQVPSKYQFNVCPETRTSKVRCSQ